MNPINALFNSNIIYRDKDPKTFKEVKSFITNNQEFVEFIKNKLNCNLKESYNFIKLNKVICSEQHFSSEIGNNIKNTLTNKKEYVLLALLFKFLEERVIAGRDFRIKNLVDSINDNYPADNKVDFTKRKNKRYLIKVLKLALEWGIIKKQDGNLDEHEAHDAEVLFYINEEYRFLANAISKELLSPDVPLNHIEDAFYIDVTSSVYQKLLFFPALIKEEGNQKEFEFLTKNYENIRRDFERFFDATLHLYNECAFLVFDSKLSYSEDLFPTIHCNSKNILKITMFIINIILDKIEKNLLKDERNYYLLDEELFEDIIKECKENYNKYWSKKYKDYSLKKMNKELIAVISKYHLVQEDKHNNQIKVFPTIHLFKGTKINKGEVTNESIK